MASYVQLEPSSFSNEGLGVTAPKFNGTGSFIETSTFVYTLLFIAIIGAAFYEYVLVGIYRMQASEGGIRKSNETFKRTTLGLLGVFSLFLIIAALNRSMLTGNVDLSAVKVSVDGTGTVVIPKVTTPNSTSVTKGGSTPGWDAIYADPQAREALRNLPGGGISVNKPVCADPTYKGCTTVGGLPSETVSMLSNLRSTCSGSIEITGGTEAGHSSHGPGRYPVDLSLRSSSLESCIRGFPKGPALNFCKVTYRNFGFTFCDEEGVAHWHVFK